MSDMVFLIHGWSVDETTTYQALHLKLAEEGFDLHHINLGRYVSLDNDVEIRDLAKALHDELQKEGFLGAPPWNDRFHIVTHSTGALVVKHWILNHYADDIVQTGGLKNLVFLAGPHFGSRLAHPGRSMLAHISKLGDTGRKILDALELGSTFSWDNNGGMLDASRWRARGIRPYCLIGDRVARSFADRIAERVFPARYEDGSDMVVRVPAANLNFRRYELNAATGRQRRVDEISGVPFAALWQYTHSGDEHGIMNSITRRSSIDSPSYLNLRLTVDCLRVNSASGYAAMRTRLEGVNAQTRGKRDAFAQLDFRFRDDSGVPIDDYLIELGYVDDNGRSQPSKAITHSHKNQVDPSHFTFFVDRKKLDKELRHAIFFRFRARPHTLLLEYHPDPYTYRAPGAELSNVIRADHTTQIDVILSRTPSDDLFVFHHGDDPDLHVKWNRQGEVVRTRQRAK